MAIDILIDWQRHRFKVSGEPIEMELRPLETSGVFKLMALDLKSPDEKQVEIMLDIVVKYVRDIKGLTVGGQPAKPEDIVNVSQLMPLCADIMNRLTEISNLSRADEKK